MVHLKSIRFVGPQKEKSMGNPCAALVTSILRKESVAPTPIDSLMLFLSNS